MTSRPIRRFAPFARRCGLAARGAARSARWAARSDVPRVDRRRCPRQKNEEQKEGQVPETTPLSRLLCVSLSRNQRQGPLWHRQHERVPAVRDERGLPPQRLSQHPVSQELHSPEFWRDGEIRGVPPLLLRRLRRRHRLRNQARAMTEARGYRGPPPAARRRQRDGRCPI
jgi:hypothetical protein